jgi:hypothetical protein
VRARAVPPVLLDLDPRTGEGGVLRDEVPSEPQPELLDLANTVLLGEGEDGVLLRVRRQDVGVVAGQVRGVEVAGKRDAHVEVGQLVRGLAAVDPYQADLGLAV